MGVGLGGIKGMSWSEADENTLYEILREQKYFKDYYSIVATTYQ